MGSGKKRMHAETINPSSFFKLIVTPSQSTRLRLPQTFANAFEDKLSVTCHLTVPTGETNPVTLVKEDSGLCFRDGWNKFVDRFSISYRYFLQFMYNGDSNFRVHIFDLSACEISYSIHEGTNFPMEEDLSPQFPEQHGRDDFGLQYLVSGDSNDDIGLTNMHSPSANHKKSAEEIIELDRENDVIVSGEWSGTSADTRNHGDGLQGVTFAGVEIPGWLLRYSKELKAVAAAGISTPGYPFFVASVKPYSLTSGGFMNIPRGFVRDHLKCKSWECTTVKMSERKKWVMRCNRNGPIWSLGKGWVKFAQEAFLYVGDVCLFELIDAENWVLKVRVISSS